MADFIDPETMARLGQGGLLTPQTMEMARMRALDAQMGAKGARGSRFAQMFAEKPGIGAETPPPQRNRRRQPKPIDTALDKLKKAFVPNAVVRNELGLGAGHFGEEALGAMGVAGVMGGWPREALLELDEKELDALLDQMPETARNQWLGELERAQQRHAMLQKAAAQGKGQQKR